MKIFINKREVEIASALSVLEFLELQDIKPQGIALAINNRIIGRDNWSTTHLNESDNITIIQATYGG